MRYREVRIELTEIAQDAITSRLMDLGCLGTIEENGRVTAYFEGSADLAAITREIGRVRTALEQAGLTIAISLSSEVIEGQDWNRTWKAGFVPLDVGDRFTVLPPWEDGRPGRTSLVIDPGMAFGTGHHETTRSCLILMEAYAGKTPRSHFLDLGTGTGLLAIAAVHLGFGHVVAIDTDPLAIDAVKHNLELNHMKGVEVVAGDLSSACGEFDLIAANLISGTLVALAADIGSRMRPKGFAVLSGILIGQENEVIAAMTHAGLRHQESLRDGKWISLVMTRP